MAENEVHQRCYQKILPCIAGQCVVCVERIPVLNVQPLAAISAKNRSKTGKGDSEFLAEITIDHGCLAVRTANSDVEHTTTDGITAGH